MSADPPRTLDAVDALLADAGAAPVHARHLLQQWLHARPLDTPYRGDPGFLPRRVRDALPALAARLDAIARVFSRHPGADGGERLLVALADGRSVECVRLPHEALCVSVQVGCAVGCGFCTTGRDGLVRQLGAAEIVAQVAAARRFGPVRRLVFMGMGEPAHNLDAVLDAIGLLTEAGGFARDRITVSTVGDRRLFARLLAAPRRPGLALSLHATDPVLRARLLPRAAPIAPDELVDLADAVARASRIPLLVQWTLLDGTNDDPDAAAALARLLAGRRAIVNLIPWNAADGLPFARPPLARSIAFLQALRAHGVVATLRRSAAQDVDGGCGQLRARVLRVAVA